MSGIFHGRGVAGVERKTRLTATERSRRRKLVAGVAILSALFFYAAALLWATLVSVGFERIEGVAPRILSDPFPFAEMDGDGLLGCVCWGIVAALVPWGFYSSWLRRQGNYDPGAEHGDSRLATPADFAELADHELISNNLRFTTNCAICVQSRTQELALATSGINRNFCCIGTTGGGKTSSVVKPIIAASLGTRLCPGGMGPEGMINPGFDIVFTDTKGDVLPDVGHALSNSGADIRCFNTRDPRSSDRCNPFAAVHAPEMDAVDLRSCKAKIVCQVDGSEMPLGCDGDQSTAALELAFDGTEHALAGPSTSDAGEWFCATCGALNPGSAYACVEEGCDGMRVETSADAIALSFKAGLFGDAEHRCASILIRARNRSGLERHVRIEVSLPFGARFDAGTLTATDEECGELLLNPQGEPVFRWDFVLPPNSVIGADVDAHAEKVRTISGSMLTRICSCIVSNLNASEDGAKEDAFWPRCSSSLFQGDAGLLLEVWGPKECTLPAVLSLILDQEVDPAGLRKDAVDILMDAWETGMMPAPPRKGTYDSSDVDFVPCDIRDMSPIEILEDGYWKPKPGQRWFGRHDRSLDSALSAYHTYRKGAVETRQSVLISAASTLRPIMSPEIRELLSEDTLNLAAFGSGDGSHALAIISHDMDKTFKPLIALVFYLTILTLDENATKRPGAKLPRHVHILADEFKNLGKLPEVDGALSTVRSKNVSIGICVQSHDQLDGTYGEHVANELRDCCATILFLGGSNEKTLKSFETLSGTETIDMVQTSRSYGPNGQVTESRQAVQRPVVSVGQLRTCPDTHAYVLMKGRPAFKDWKIGWGAYDYYEWFDPTRENRWFSDAGRKFQDYFDFQRYQADREAGRPPYDYDESLKSLPGPWRSADDKEKKGGAAA